MTLQLAMAWNLWSDMAALCFLPETATPCFPHEIHLAAPAELGTMCLLYVSGIKSDFRVLDAEDDF